MKKFSNNINEKINPFAENDILKTKVYNMINETLKLTIDGMQEKYGSSYIDGTKELTEMIVQIIRGEEIKEEIATIEKIKENPVI
jgi:hypothetical protein